MPLRSPNCHNSNPDHHHPLPPPIKLQQQWSRSTPGVRKQCCSGNFRASPPVAFEALPTPLFFFFQSPAGAKMPHGRAFSGCSGSAHMLMFYSLCASGCIMKGRPPLVLHKTLAADKQTYEILTAKNHHRHERMCSGCRCFLNSFIHSACMPPSTG